MEITTLPTKGTVLARALINILSGIVLLVWPGMTLLILVYAFALNFLLTGVATMFEPLFERNGRSALLSILLGLLSIVVGVFLLARPMLTGEILALLIALWALIFGLVDIYIGLASSRDKSSGSQILILPGILSVIFGIYMLLNPLASALALVWVIGIFALTIGIILGIFGLFFYPNLKLNKKK